MGKKELEPLNNKLFLNSTHMLYLILFNFCIFIYCFLGVSFVFPDIFNIFSYLYIYYFLLCRYVFICFCHQFTF